EVNALRCFREAAGRYEEQGCFLDAGILYERAGYKELGLFMGYISLLDIDPESKTLFRQHKYVEGVQSLFEKKLISEEAYKGMFDGRGQVSSVCDSRRTTEESKSSSTCRDGKI
ncbi:hypothetical protein EBR77_01175, partial [bacterium]|nr:hypothetical protein [bacterium]